MVTVAVGHNHKIELLQIGARCFHVVFKDLGIVARVEKDAFATIVDQGRKPPIHGQCRRFAEGIIQNGDAVWRSRDRHVREHQNENRQGAKGNVPHTGASLVLSPFPD
jgi:hypothetical protein